MFKRLILILLPVFMFAILLGCSQANQSSSTDYKSWQAGYEQGYKDGLNYSNSLRPGGSGTWTETP
jgi:hypothetical protein